MDYNAAMCLIMADISFNMPNIAAIGPHKSIVGANIAAKGPNMRWAIIVIIFAILYLLVVKLM